uniref:Peroxin-7 n=1 Tax=Palpitomonas bilix TaxID=652834 RepID=A0A7S3GAL2_9EUKA
MKGPVADPFPSPPSLRFRTYSSGASIKFSSCASDIVAVASNSHFGMAGKGIQQVFRTGAHMREKEGEKRVKEGEGGEVGNERYNMGEVGRHERGGGVEEIARFISPSTIFSSCFSEEDGDLLLSACGDGIVRGWSIVEGSKCLYEWKGGHAKEINDVAYTLLGSEVFLSGGWDGNVCMWSVRRAEPMAVWRQHSTTVYDVTWSPRDPYLALTAAGDGFAVVIDTREGKQLIRTCVHDGGEVLSATFDKYDSNLILTGGADGSIRAFDLRRMHEPTCMMLGHDLAVKEIQSSPFRSGVVASVSYDMSCRVWDLKQAPHCQRSVLHPHTEFITSVDWSVHDSGILGTTSWDNTAAILHVQS